MATKPDNLMRAIPPDSGDVWEPPPPEEWDGTTVWKQLKWEARHWPIFMGYWGWSPRTSASFHSDLLLDMVRRQNDILGVMNFPRWFMRWWPAPIGFLISLIFAVFLPWDADGAYFLGRGWLNIPINAAVITVFVSAAISYGILPLRWYNKIYAEVTVITRRRNPKTGLTKIYQVGQIPMPRMGFVATDGDHFTGSARSAGVSSSNPVLDAGEGDLRKMMVWQIWDLPPSRGEYIGNTARQCRAMMELAYKAGDLYLDVNARKKWNKGKVAFAGLLTIIAAFAAFNIIAGGGTIDVTQIQAVIGGGS